MPFHHAVKQLREHTTSMLNGTRHRHLVPPPVPVIVSIVESVAALGALLLVDVGFIDLDFPRKEGPVTLHVLADPHHHEPRRLLIQLHVAGELVGRQSLLGIECQQDRQKPLRKLFIPL
ncbi:MAG: hypothetical protein OXG36_10340 [Caldilineaceae bacterium]|nr:hypothetical protein [Caldilineaceae bacterium]